MPRAVTDGLRFIGIPTNWFSLPEHRILRAKLGDKAMLVWLDLYVSCFQFEGYYRALSEDDIALMAAEYHTSDIFIKQVLSFLAQRSLVDAELLRRDQVVTSEDIQKSFQTSSREKGRKRQIEVCEEYWLLGEEETAPFIKLCPRKNHSGKNGDKSVKNSRKTVNNKGKTLSEDKKRENKKRHHRIRLSRPLSGRKRRVRLKGRMVGQSISQRGERIRREYEGICGGVLPAQERITQGQLAFIRKGTLGGLTMKDYRGAFEAVRESGFLMGENGKWRATFGWLVNPEKTRRVLAGEYRSYSTGKAAVPTVGKEKSGSENSSFDTDEFFEAALRRSYEDMGKYLSFGET